MQEAQMHLDIRKFNEVQSPKDQEICQLLAREIDRGVPDAGSKIWHAHPVWFLEDNPIVGYNKLKDSVRLLFWSGQSFEEGGLKPSGSFKAAEVRYTEVGQIDMEKLARWLSESREI
jgi:hypothetical protein